MAKKVDDWVIVVIVVLAALLVANIFVTGTIFRSLASVVDRSSPNKGALKLAPGFGPIGPIGPIGPSTGPSGSCGCSTNNFVNPDPTREVDYVSPFNYCGGVFEKQCPSGFPYQCGMTYWYTDGGFLEDIHPCKWS